MTSPLLPCEDREKMAVYEETDSHLTPNHPVTSFWTSRPQKLFSVVYKAPSLYSCVVAGLFD